MNQVNTQYQTTAIWTTNFRDCKELYHYDIFPPDYGFYTDDVTIKEAFEKKFYERYYMTDLAWDQIAIWKHYFKNLMDIESVRYKQLFDLKLSELQLDNVNITELIKRDLKGEGKTSSSAESTNQSDNTDKSLVKDFDTPQGRVSPSNMEGHISGLTDSDRTGSSSGKGSSSGTSENKAESSEETVRSLKGYQGTKTLQELKYEVMNAIINLDKIIIEDCKKLFLGLY